MRSIFGYAVATAVIALVLINPEQNVAAPVLSGEAVVVDGDTIKIAHIIIDLKGIDAPEVGQRCRQGKSQSWWACGKIAADFLATLIANRQVSCELSGESMPGSLGYCTVRVVQGQNSTKLVDINAQLVQAGLALAQRQQSDVYVGHEEVARLARNGMWMGDFTKPWDYRQGRRLAWADQDNDRNE